MTHSSLYTPARATYLCAYSRTPRLLCPPLHTFAASLSALPFVTAFSTMMPCARTSSSYSPLCRLWARLVCWATWRTFCAPFLGCVCICLFSSPAFCLRLYCTASCLPHHCMLEGNFPAFIVFSPTVACVSFHYSNMDFYVVNGGSFPGW